MLESNPPTMLWKWHAHEHLAYSNAAACNVHVEREEEETAAVHSFEACLPFDLLSEALVLEACE
jgi:hypothetical protein